MTPDDLVAEEYRSLTPLQTRILTHQRYSEDANDVDLDVLRALDLDPAGALLDVGSGTGEFQRRLRAEGHTGRLCVLDMSQAAVDAAGAVQGVEGFPGDAQALPFPDATFDAVTARHMLYHVPDPVLAIREARRVLRPGGRFAAVVNLAGTMPLIHGVVDTVLAAHGFGRADGAGLFSVNADNLPGLFDVVFSEREVITVKSALVFHEPEPIIAYCLTMLGFGGVPDQGAERDRVEADLAAEVRGRFAELGGVWRDPKGYIVCAATK